MISSSPRIVAMRTTYVHYPRDGELLGTLVAGLERLLLRVRTWQEERRRAAEAERWLESATDRDLADIGLVRAAPWGFQGGPPRPLFGTWDAL